MTYCSSYSFLFDKSFALARFNLPLVFSTIRGRRQLPGNDCRVRNSFMFHFPFKLSSSCVANEFSGRCNSESGTWPPPGTPMQMFSYSFWLLVSFSDKTKTNKHPVRQEANSLLGRNDTERQNGFFFLPVV